MAKDTEELILLDLILLQIFEHKKDREASKGKLQLNCSGLLDCCSAIDILSIKFVELLLPVSDCWSASILFQLLHLIATKIYGRLRY